MSLRSIWIYISEVHIWPFPRHGDAVIPLYCSRKNSRQWAVRHSTTFGGKTSVLSDKRNSKTAWYLFVHGQSSHTGADVWGYVPPNAVPKGTQSTILREDSHDFWHDCDFMILSFEIIGIRRFLLQNNHLKVTELFCDVRLHRPHRATAQLRGWGRMRSPWEPQESLEESLSEDSKLRWIWAPENLRNGRVGKDLWWTDFPLVFEVLYTSKSKRSKKKRECQIWWGKETYLPTSTGKLGGLCHPTGSQLSCHPPWWAWPHDRQLSVIWFHENFDP